MSARHLWSSLWVAFAVIALQVTSLWRSNSARSWSRSCEGRGEALTADEVSLLSALATAYEERGDWLRAREVASDAVNYANQIEDDVAAGRAFWAASTVLAQSGDLGEALRLANRSLAKFGDAVDEGRLASVAATRAWIELKQSAPDVARIRTDLERVIGSLRRVSSPADVAAAETELARCHLLLVVSAINSSGV